MKKSKIGFLVLSLLLIGPSLAGVYFGVNSLTTNFSNSEQIKSLETFKKKKDEVKVVNLKSLNQNFYTNNSYYSLNGQKNVAIEFDNKYFQNKIDELLKKDLNVSEDDILLLPSFFYDLYAKNNQRLKTLTYKNVPYSSPNYELSNSLNLVISKNAKERGVISSFVDFLKESSMGRAIIYSNMNSLIPYQNNLGVEKNKCFNYKKMQTSSSKWKSMMGSLYLTLNCSSNYGFTDFDLNSFLSTFLEIEGRKVIVDDEKASDDSENKEYISLEEAKRLSNERNIKKGDEVTIYEDFVKYFSSLTIDNLNPLLQIPSTLLRKTKEFIINDDPDPLKILEGIVKSNDKINSKSANTLMAAMLTILGSVNSVHKDALNTQGFESSIKNGDLSKILLTRTASGLENMVKKIIYADSDWVSFFFNSVINNDNSNNKKTWNLVLDDYEKNLLENSQLIASKTIEINELKQTISNNEEELKELQKTQVSWSQSDDYRDYSILQRQLNSERESLSLLKNQLTTNEIILQSYQNNMLKLVEESSNSNLYKDEINNLKSLILDLQTDMASLQSNINKKENLINKILTDLTEIEKENSIKEIKEKLDYQSNLIIENEKLKKEKSRLEDKVFDYNREISSLNKRIKVLKDWPTKSTTVEAVNLLKSLNLSDSMAIFLDVVSTVSFDALNRLGLGEYESNGGFTFKTIDLCGISCIDVTFPFFKDKEAVNVLNKMMDFLNNLANSFTNNTIESSTKLLLNLFPDALFELLNTKANILGISVDFSKGVDITPKQLYTTIAGISGGASAGIGAILGGFGAGLIKGFKTKSAKKGLIAGAIGGLVGGISSAIVGASVGAGVTYAMFGDATLHVTAPNPKIIEILLDLKARKDKGENIAFNLFTDGHILLKENYLPEINEVFKDLAKLFFYSEPILMNKVNAINSKYSNKEFTSWNFVGEIMKSIFVSPYFWKLILTKSNFEFDDYNNQVLKSTILESLKNEVTYDKDLIRTFTKENINSEYVDDLYSLHVEIIKWFIDSTIVSRDTKYVTNVIPSISVGYDSSQIRLSILNKLEREFKKLTKTTIDFNWVDYKSQGLENLDAYFVYSKINNDLINKGLLNLNVLRMNSMLNNEIEIPLYKTPFVALTLIRNRTISNIDKAFLEKKFS